MTILLFFFPFSNCNIKSRRPSWEFIRKIQRININIFLFFFVYILWKNAFTMNQMSSLQRNVETIMRINFSFIFHVLISQRTTQLIVHDQFLSEDCNAFCRVYEIINCFIFSCLFHNTFCSFTREKEEQTCNNNN